MIYRQVQGLARRIGSKGQLAVRAAIQAVRGGLERELRRGESEAHLFGDLCDWTISAKESRRS